MDIDGVILPVIPVFPYLFIEAFPGKYLPGLLYQNAQNLIFVSGQGNLPLLYRDGSGC